MYFTVPYFLCRGYLLHCLRIMDIVFCIVKRLVKCLLIKVRYFSSGLKVGVFFLLHKVREVELSGNIYIGIKINLFS